MNENVVVHLHALLWAHGGMCNAERALRSREGLIESKTERAKAAPFGLERFGRLIVLVHRCLLADHFELASVAFALNEKAKERAVDPVNAAIVSQQEFAEVRAAPLLSLTHLRTYLRSSDRDGSSSDSPVRATKRRRSALNPFRSLAIIRFLHEQLDGLDLTSTSRA